MSAAVPGHGFRMRFRPCCKCGWEGEEAFGEGLAVEQFERHKATVRHKLGMPAAPGHELPWSPKVIDGGKEDE